MRLALALAALVVASVSARASGTIAYGSRAGMEVDVISMSGLDTPNAVIRTRHTRTNAISFCRDYVGKVTESCIRDELATRLNDEITANCAAGTFKDFSGTEYQFTGPIKLSEDGASAKYGVVDLTAGEVADGSNASGYIINMLIFKALCPSKVPNDDF